MFRSINKNVNIGDFLVFIISALKRPFTPYIIQPLSKQKLECRGNLHAFLLTLEVKKIIFLQKECRKIMKTAMIVN